ncbi:hypothetical protein [Pseudogemmobacter bohemicus]|uniref:hypothetical protein n=1 Tax=Pseudogemmobacter bohemicus TaxID=2250708 RepID=UPI000DD46AA8|nr:hypothetical protein [Pseudogemmobacter bohemicus]
MAEPARIEIRGKNVDFYILQNDQILPRRFWSYDSAAVAAQRLEEKQLHRGAMIRPCICCLQIFSSSHRFNRLCTRCSEEIA